MPRFKVKNGKIIRSEHTEQCQIISWLKSQYPDVLCNASPAGVRYGRGREAIIRGKLMKCAGAVAGFPDIFIFEPTCFHSILLPYHGLAIELKRENGSPSDVSLEQQRWIDALNKRGYKAVVCYGYDEAIKVIADYLGRAHL